MRTEDSLRDAWANTEAEIFAEAVGDMEPEDLLYHSEHVTDRSPEQSEGWDGNELSDAEIAETNAVGYHGPGFDRPLEHAAAEEELTELAARDERIADLQRQVGELQRVADPERQARTAQERDDAITRMVADPMAALNEIGALNQRVAELEMGRVDTAMGAAHRAHGKDFEVAYKALTSRPRDVVTRAIVHGIVTSADPGQALMDWHQGVGSRFSSTGNAPPFMPGSRSRGVAPPRLGRDAEDTGFQMPGDGVDTVERDIFDSAFR